MSTPVTTNGHLTDAPNFCEHCGNPLTGGRFCPECGKPMSAPADEAPAADEPAIAAQSADDDTVAETPADQYADQPTEAFDGPVAPRSPVPPADAKPVAAADRPARRGKGPLIAGVLVGLALIAGAIVAVVVLAGSNGTDPDTAYKQKVASAFGPVLGANRQVSDSLTRLRGTSVKGSHAANARLAVRRAQQATTLATGAISAVSAPASSDQLGRDSRQVLDHENAYLAAVAAVLAHPTSASTSQLPTLASNLTSAFSVAGPTVAGTQPTVSGADRLSSWARKIRRKHDAAVRRQRAHHTQSTSHPAAATTTRASAPASGTSCGGGVFAGPNTSCAFALNVRDAYNEAPGSSATVRVFSPVTDQTYTMSCAPSGSGITCSGANNASVTF
jgi:hypothetical protein